MFDFPTGSLGGYNTQSEGRVPSNGQLPIVGECIGEDNLAPVILSVSPPPGPLPKGCFWFNTSTSVLSIWVPTPEDGYWEEINESSTGCGEPIVTVSSSPPINPSLGDLWWNPGSNELSVWAISPEGEKWSPITTGVPEDPSPPVSISVSPPGNPKNNYLWFNPQALELRVWNNSTWSIISKSFPEFLNYNGTGKVNGSVLYYNAGEASMKADSTWTIPNITDGGNF